MLDGFVLELLQGKGIFQKIYHSKSLDTTVKNKKKRTFLISPRLIRHYNGNF